MAGGRILIVDDEANARLALGDLLRDEGYAVEEASDGVDAFARLLAFAPDLVLTDLKMPGMDGLELIRKVRAHDPETVVIVMTAFAAVETAVAAMREGAADYLTKPINMVELSLVLRRELDRRRLRAETADLRARLADHDRFQGIIGSAPRMQELFKSIAQVAGSRASVLITGESGTGKELVAAAIHERSPRSKGPFIKLHCAALAESILESELFGHERGSFTGAAARREGRFSQADGGTLFLDEIGDVAPGVQVKLLRFLQEHEFERVGGNETLQVDVRVLAATNRDLKAAVADRRFREDLYYRLNVINIDVPPLRDRRSDIPILATAFLAKYAALNDKAIETFSEDALRCLVDHPWPGNVRELENVVERAVVMCTGRSITAADLPAQLGPAGGNDGHGIRIPGSTLADVERHAILSAMQATGGATGKAAELLGISVRKIQYKLHEYQSAPKSGGRAVEDEADAPDSGGRAVEDEADAPEGGGGVSR